MVFIGYKSIVLREDKYIMILFFKLCIINKLQNKWVGRLEVKWRQSEL
jgi:hypothetical protein